MGCTNSGSQTRNGTICLYRGNVIELEDRPRSWERMYAELKRRVGKDEMEVSVVQPGSTVSLVTETSWASISHTKSRLVLLIQPDSIEEALNLQMTGLRKRDRKYTEVSQTLARLKTVTDEFDRSLAAWMELSGQKELTGAVVLTYYEGPAGIKVTDQFPYLMAEGESQTGTMWEFWLEFVCKLQLLERTLAESSKHIEFVANQRAIKQIGLFKKTTINTSIATAQENNVKMSLTRERLSAYTTNISSLKSAITSVISKLHQKAVQRPALSRYRSAVSSWVNLCIQ